MKSFPALINNILSPNSIIYLLSVFVIFIKLNIEGQLNKSGIKQLYNTNKCKLIKLKNKVAPYLQNLKTNE